MAAATGRKVRDAAEARALLEAWATSGQPMAAWCKEQGINWYSLSAYKGWPGRKGEDFVEVETTSRVRPAQTAVPACRYRVVRGACVVEVDADFDDAVLLRLLRVVAAC